MKIKTSELIGPALDWAVTYALYGEQARYIYKHSRQRNSYSTCWAHGGPLIEWEKINVVRCNDMYFPKGNEFGYYYEQLWRAEPYDMDSISQRFYGPTPLIAAMRCYVCSVMGDVVEVPEELT